jgi:hypothetical protein
VVSYCDKTRPRLPAGGEREGPAEPGDSGGPNGTRKGHWTRTDGQARERAQRRRTGHAERSRTRGASMLAYQLVPSSTDDRSNGSHWRAVRPQVEQAVDALEASSVRAPTAETTSAARNAAEALRGLIFAPEAQRILYEGTQSPTTEQLVAADASIRSRTADVDAALSALDGAAYPPS